MYGADISVYHLFINALLPATLGNIVGGGIFVGAVYWYVFDSMTSGIQIFSRIRQEWSRHQPHIAFHRRHLHQENNANSNTSVNVNGGSDNGVENGHVVVIDNEERA